MPKEANHIRRVIRPVQAGSTITSYASSDGVNWTSIATQTLNLNSNVYVGLVENSGNNSSVATATSSCI